ncbi:AdoMet dependent proline di-methyltransferase-domain-containing protein [Xylaria cf. heliscus]|nr:AdoMet dependent proline di-methyltransferase-domain-containing protein [Xylaria cf. heliscus]
MENGLNESSTGSEAVFKDSAFNDAGPAAIAQSRIEEKQDEEEAKSPDAAINQHVALQYWQSVDASTDSMLGGIPSLSGFSHISKVDLQGSRSFLAKLGIGNKNGRRSVASILEGGAGVGRVTEGLLLHVGTAIDVIEPVQRFTDQLQGKKGIRTIFNVGLEDWEPTPGVEYDFVWMQWCVGHLTNEQLVQCLKRCKAALNKDDGLIIVKENISTSGFDIFDSVDSSVTREDRTFRDIFKAAGLRIVKVETQKGLSTKLPRRLFPVQTYALRPNVEPSVS